MASLPDVPTNTIIAFGVFAVTGLVAYTQKLRTSIEVQVHDNYRHAKVVDAELQGVTPVNLHNTEKSVTRSA